MNSHQRGLRIAAWLANDKGVGNALVRFTERPVSAWMFALNPATAARAGALVGSMAALKELAMVAGLEETRIVRQQAPNGTPLLAVVAPSPVAGHLSGAQLRGQGLAVPLGLRLDRVPIHADAGRLIRDMGAWLDFAATDNPHLRIIGGSGSGKTSIALQIVRCLAQQNAPTDLDIIVVSDRRKDWHGLESMPHAMGGLTLRPDALAVAEWVAEEVVRREQGGRDGRWLFLVLDDSADTVAEHPTIKDALAVIARRGRAVKVALLPNTQGPGKDEIGGAQVHNSVLNNVTLRVADGDAARRATGVSGSGAGQATRRGLGTLTLGGVAMPVLFARGMPDDLLMVAGGTPKPAPWKAFSGRGFGNGRNGETELAVPPSWVKTTVQEPLQQPVSPVSPISAPTSPIAPVSPPDPKVEKVRTMLLEQRSQGDIILEVWGAKPGRGAGYVQATEELKAIIKGLVGGANA